WWAAHAETSELPDRLSARPAERYLGNTLVIMQQTNTVAEYGPDGKQLWQMGQAQGLVGIWDAQVVGHDRLLLTEYSARRVSERNFRGDVLWQKALNNYPLTANRLPNGHTLIVLRNQVLEVDRAGRELTTLTRQPNDVIMSAGKTRDGHFVLLTN